MPEKPPKWVVEAEKTIRKAILEIDDRIASEVYVLSFLLDCPDDELRRSSAIFGFNTESQFQKANPDSTLKGRKAYDADEAKWNYAFWVQNELSVIGGDDLEFQKWVQQLPGYCTQEQEEKAKGKELKEIEKNIARIHDTFIEMMLPIIRKLHEDGTILKKFGRDIPMIFHELEYFSLTIKWAKATNPDGQAKDFIHWIKTM